MIKQSLQWDSKNSKKVGIITLKKRIMQNNQMYLLLNQNHNKITIFILQIVQITY